MPATRQTPPTAPKLPVLQTVSTNIVIEGSQIINMHKLQQYINQLSIHAAKYGHAITLTGETREGLASIVSSHCTKCGYMIQLESSSKVIGPRGYKRWECNLAAVWGQMTQGGGRTSLRDSMSTLGVPTMTKKSFIQTERDIGEKTGKLLHIGVRNKFCTACTQGIPQKNHVCYKN